uniref:Uncharacterized protein n=2 Tax=Chrysotila carterae TaxID=13221 RepID=A0A7S4F006_CHRCT
MHHDDGWRPPDYLSAEDLEGCWCVTPLLGGFCYGLQAQGPNALLENPIPCLCGVPFCKAWGLGTCGAPLYQRDGNSNTFRNHGDNESLIFKSKTEHLLTAIPSLGKPRVIKLCGLPQCCFSVFQNPCCCCCNGVYR